MDHNLFQGVGILSYTASLVSTSEIASWTYIIIAIVSMIAGMVSIVINLIKSLKDGKLDDDERQALLDEIDQLRETLDKINKPKE